MTVKRFPSPHLSRRHFLAGSGAITLAVSHPALAQTKDVATTSFGGVWGAAYKEMILDPFQKATGTNVKLKMGAPAEWLTNGIVTRRRPDIDVLMLPYPQSIQAVMQDLSVPLDEKEIPNLANVERVWIDQYGGTAVGLDYVAYGISARMDLLPKPLKSWKDLWDPAFEQKLAVPAITQAGAWELLVMASRLHGGDENNLEPGFQALKRLRPNIKKFIGGGNEHAQLLEAGEVVAVAMSTNTTPYALQDAGRPVDFLVLEEGSMVGMVSYHVAKNAANKAAAMAFINFALAKEQQVNFCSKLIAGPVIKGAELIGKAKERVPPLDRLIVFDWKALAPRMPELSERWNREVVA